MHVARLLASACIFLYLFVFSILFFLASSHGASMERMIGLEGGRDSDVTEYVWLAHTMLDVHRFALSPTAAPDYARVPGYPAFIAIVLLIFHTDIVIPLIQIVFTACTVALIYLIGVRYFSRSVALFAATVYMIDPVVMLVTWTPLSETLFMLFFMGSVYMIGVHAKRSWLPVAVAGILLGLSMYMRPVGTYLAPIIACMVLAHSTSWRVAAKNIAIFIIATVCVASPWMLRNYANSGHFAFSSDRDWEIYFVFVPQFEQARTGVDFHKILAQNNQQLFGIQDDFILRSFEYASREAAFSRQVILAHPFEYIAYHLTKTMLLFVSSSIVKVTYHMHQFGILAGDHAQGEGTWGMLLLHRWHDAFIQTFEHIPRLIERIFLMFAYGGAVYATVLALFKRDRSAREVWIICAFIFMNLYALMIGPGSDDTRYRIPIEPFIFLLGGYGVTLVWPRIQKFLHLEKTALRLSLTKIG